MLLSRILVAIVFIPLLLAVALVRGPLLLAAVAIATAIACGEFALMFHQRDLRVPIVGTVLVGLSYLWAAESGQAVWPLLLGAALIALLWTALLTPAPIQKHARAFALAVAGGSYIGFCTSFALLLGHLPGGDLWLVTALLGDWAADVGGFFAGRALGRHRLAPAISPSKTWEGVVGALLLPVIAMGLLSLLLPIPLAHVIPFGLAVGGAAIVGDLTESWAKRLAGVKDASHLLGGHGGFLDRMDSLFLVLPTVYLYAVVFVAR